MSEPVIRLLSFQSRPVIRDCKWIIDTYLNYNAYVAYDYGGTYGHTTSDTLTDKRLRAVNSAMAARSSPKLWANFLNRPLSELQQIPVDLDLIDGSDADVEQAQRGLLTLVARIAHTPGLTDMAATKMLHLLRQRFVAISDSLVRASLQITDDAVGPWLPAQRGEWFAARATLLQQRIRELGKSNSTALDELLAWANNLPPFVVKPGQAYAAEPYVGQTIPVRLSKVRILDILLLADEALNRREKWWQNQYEQRTKALSTP